MFATAANDARDEIANGICNRVFTAHAASGVAQEEGDITDRFRWPRRPCIVRHCSRCSVLSLSTDQLC